MKKENKSTTWKMRLARSEKMNIAKLARRLNVKESEAVRRAVVFYLLAEKSKSLPVMDLR